MAAAQAVDERSVDHGSRGGADAQLNENMAEANKNVEEVAEGSDVSTEFENDENIDGGSGGARLQESLNHNDAIVGDEAAIQHVQDNASNPQQQGNINTPSVETDRNQGNFRAVCSRICV